MKKLVYVGLDVHRDTIVIAVARSGREPAMQLATVAHDELALMKCLEDVASRSLLRICYEAGPTGYGLARRLNESGICCVVVAPSLVPVQQGCRVKTDRRDAVKLAHFLRSGDLVEVSVPAAQNEAMRDLERAREDAVIAQRIARQQLSKFFLRHSRTWSGTTTWTTAHWLWIGHQEFNEEGLRRVRDDYVTAIVQATAVTAVARELVGFVWAIAREDKLLVA